MYGPLCTRPTLVKSKSRSAFRVYYIYLVILRAFALYTMKGYEDASCMIMYHSNLRRVVDLTRRKRPSAEFRHFSNSCVNASDEGFHYSHVLLALSPRSSLAGPNTAYPGSDHSSNAVHIPALGWGKSSMWGPHWCLSA